MPKTRILARILISATMIAFAAHSVRWEPLRATILALRWYIPLVAIGGYIITQLLAVARWQLVLQYSGIICEYSQILRVHFIGAFINSFGLGTLGGDTAKSILMIKSADRLEIVVGTVLFDRALGWIILCTIALLGASFAESSKIVAIAHPVFAITAVTFTAAIAGQFLKKHLLRRAGKYTRPILDLLNAIPSDLGDALRLLATATVVQLTQMSTLYLVTVVMGHDVPAFDLFTALSLTSMAAALPLSWMGFGIRENCLIFFLSPEFLSREEAVILSSLWFFAMIVVSGLGGAIMVLTKNGWTKSNN